LYDGARKEYTIASRKVFVGNLNFDTTKRELEEALGEAGKITDVHIPVDRNTGKPRGFAFVEFSDSSEAAEAIARFNGFELSGRALRINEAEERRPRAPGGPRPSFDRGGGGNSFGGFRDEQSGGGGGDHYGGKPSRPKGSRRGMRGKKRSL
jgi:RNA recognition motif-containing protein